MGSSSSSVVAEPAPVSDAANRMRDSSTRRRWPPDSVRSGCVRTRSGRPRLAQMRPASLSARVPAERGEPLLELAVAAHRAVAGGVVGDLGHQRLLLLQVGQQGVEAAGRQHPVAGQDVEVALSGILWQITDFAGAGDGARVGLALACQDAHGGGLARAVAADEADAVAGLHPQRRTVGGQQRARACADLEVRCGDHAALLLGDWTGYLSSVKTGGPLLGARRHRFFEVGGEQADEELAQAFGLHVPLQASGVQSTPQCALGQLDSRPGERRDPLRHLIAGRRAARSSGTARDTRPMRSASVGVDVAAGQHQLERPRGPDRARQQVAQAELAGGQAVVDARRPEVGARRRRPGCRRPAPGTVPPPIAAPLTAAITGWCILRSARMTSSSTSIDRSANVGRVSPSMCGTRARRLVVGARGEAPARAGEHDRPHGVVVGELVEHASSAAP